MMKSEKDRAKLWVKDDKFKYNFQVTTQLSK